MEQLELLTVPQVNGDVEDLPTSSRPPSPPGSGTVTPTVTIGPCPRRLTPSYPPLNYGCVDENKIYRSSYPQDRNVDFIDGLGIRTVLSLVDSDAPLGFQSWIDEARARHARIAIGTNKDKGGKIDADLTSICRAVLYLMDSSNYPVYVHCNQGKHRTGCVIGCLRRIQGWPVDEIIEEYEIYAGEKSRPGDVALIKSFNPNLVYEVAVSDGLVDDLSKHGNGGVRMVRSDSRIGDIHALRAALEAGLMGESKCIMEYATPLWHQLSRWLPTPVEWETDSSWSTSSESMAPAPSTGIDTHLLWVARDKPMPPRPSNGVDTSSDRIVDEQAKAVECIVDPKIFTPGVNKIEEGTMAPGVEAGC